MHTRKFNVGPGLTNVPSWANLDLPAQTASYQAKQPPFMHYDMMKLEDLPIPSSYAEIIYCSHVLEHVTNYAALKFLSECERTLKPGGHLRLSVPSSSTLNGVKH